MLPNNEHKRQLASFAQEQSSKLERSEFRQKLRELLSVYENLDEKQPVDLLDDFNLIEHLHHYEIKIIRYALDLTGGNQRAAAKLLGLNYTTLNNKVKRYHLGNGGA